MVRTQIQLEEQQWKRLRQIAANSGRSLAELIRESVQQYLESEGGGNRDERIERALSAAGKYRGGPADVSSEHDRYLAEGFLE